MYNNIIKSSDCIYCEYLLLQSLEDSDRKKRLEDVNQILLQNVLPKHVADHFLDRNSESVRCVLVYAVC